MARAVHFSAPAQQGQGAAAPAAPALEAPLIIITFATELRRLKGGKQHWKVKSKARCLVFEAISRDWLNCDSVLVFLIHPKKNLFRVMVRVRVRLGLGLG
jgi:hypothetical protein